MVTIGITDSGMGGLTVMKAVISMNPGYRYIYLADDSNSPYGGKSREEITELTRNCVKTLIGLGADAVVLACNTATSAAADVLRKRFAIPLVGAEPAILPALRDGHKSILVMATPFTVRSERYARLTAPYRDRIIDCPCNGLAALIDAAAPDFYKLKGMAASLLEPYKGADAVVLGCTHYALIRNLIKEFLPSAAIYDSAEGIARRIRLIMPPPEDCAKICQMPNFYTTSGYDTDKFRRVYALICGAASIEIT